MRIETAKHLFVQAMDDFLVSRDGVDAALIYENEPEIDESLYWIIGNSYIRIMVMSLAESNTLSRIANIRPAPNFNVVYGTTKTINSFIKDAVKEKLIKRDSRWNFVVTDFNQTEVDVAELETLVTVMKMTSDSCCIVLNKRTQCSCEQYKSPVPPFVSEAIKLVGLALLQLKTNGNSLLAEVDCEAQTSSSTQLASDFEVAVRFQTSQSSYNFNADKKLLNFPVEFNLSSRNKDKNVLMGKWNMENRYTKDPNYNETKLKRFFSVGTVARTPWTFTELSKDGQDVLAGYCINMIGKMAQEMSFDYEVVLPSDGSNDFGRRNADTGVWSGLIGDLVSGKVDIAVAPMTMTSEREEVVDFVAPYFDQSGISIIHRKPVVKRSLFKFLQVLKTEVWLAILAALAVTAIMIWLLDK